MFLQLEKERKLELDLNDRREIKRGKVKMKRKITDTRCGSEKQTKNNELARMQNNTAWGSNHGLRYY